MCRSSPSLRQNRWSRSLEWGALTQFALLAWYIYTHTRTHAYKIPVNGQSFYWIGCSEQKYMSINKCSFKSIDCAQGAGSCSTGLTSPLAAACQAPQVPPRAPCVPTRVYVLCDGCGSDVFILQYMQHSTLLLSFSPHHPL